MIDFRNEPSGFRVLMKHPTPWKYVGNYVKPLNTPAILDAIDNVVVTQEQVSAEVFDIIWAFYFYCLRE